MSTRRHSGRIIESSDESVLGSGNRIIFTQRVDAAEICVPAGATGEIVNTFPQLKIRIDAQFCAGGQSRVVTWPTRVDALYAIMKLRPETLRPERKSRWVDFEVTSTAALSSGSAISTWPPGAP